jgi:thiol-disulfide isomerase/thioredoxin
MKNTLMTAIFAMAFGGCYATVLTDGLPKGSTPPDLGIRGWINAEGLAERHDGPVLVEFWSKDCPRCVKNLPRIKRIQQEYTQLRVMTVHVSLERGDATQDAHAVRAFAAQAGITYPVGVDQSGACWKDFDFGYLPHAVLLDEEGRVTWSGNLFVHNIERVVRRRLGPPPVESEVAVESIDLGGEGACEGGVCRPS